MLCGLGVPSLTSLWGAVRNRQLFILRTYCKSCISFRRDRPKSPGDTVGVGEKITVSPFFLYPPPLGGGYGPKKKYPTPMCKKVSHPQFFSKERHDHLLEPTGCYFIWCKCSLHNALRYPNIPRFASTNLVALHIHPCQPKVTTKRGCWPWGPKSFGLGKIGQNDLPVFLGIVAIAQVVN